MQLSTIAAMNQDRTRAARREWKAQQRQMQRRLARRLARDAKRVCLARDPRQS